MGLECAQAKVLVHELGDSEEVEIERVTPFCKIDLGESAQSAVVPRVAYERIGQWHVA
jgi:hypothetical protein